ncbi:MAG: lysyl oxidase family protein [Bradymonadia bacterium]
MRWRLLLMSLALALSAQGCVEESDDPTSDDAGGADASTVEGDASTTPPAPDATPEPEPDPDAALPTPDAEPEPEGCPPDAPEDMCGVCGGDGPSTWYADQDDDGAGDDRITVEACAQPEGFVAEGGDPQPECATDDTDQCGVCGGAGVTAWFADQDDDGLGDDLSRIESCEQPEGFVAEGGDPEPFCTTNDTDQCGVCAGRNADMDCVGVCFGEAYEDGCTRCVGGTTGREPFVDDRDGDEIPDVCDLCHMEAARYVIQWTDIRPFRGDHGPYTFQLVLYENGDFAFLYNQVQPFGASATVGIQGDAGDRPINLSHNNEFVTDHPVVYFFHRPEDGRAEVDYAIQHPWVDIRDVGIPLELADDGTVVQELNFEFPFYGGNYDQINISANGLVSLSERIGGYSNEVFPVGNIGPTLAPFWDDLNPTRGAGEVYIYAVSQVRSCQPDCSGMRGGLAVEDECGACTGGATGQVANADMDCNGVCFGEAYEDVCGVCVGGDTGLEPSDAEACPQGPDLLIDQPYLANTAGIEYLDVEDQCLVNERCVRGTGRRKILRFGTRIANVGNEDLQLGTPDAGLDFWYWDECHGHFHFEAYARYDLVNVETGELLPIGSKNGFSVIDIGVYDPEIAVDGCVGYNGRNQGITAGCQDTYSRNLQCQWIDITDVPDGTYDLVVTTNPCDELYELDYTNNSGRARVTITGDDLDVVPNDEVEEPLAPIDFAPLCRPALGGPDEDAGVPDDADMGIPEDDMGIIDEDAGVPDEADADPEEMPDMGIMP